MRVSFKKERFASTAERLAIVGVGADGKVDGWQAEMRIAGRGTVEEGGDAGCTARGSTAWPDAAAWPVVAFRQTGRRPLLCTYGHTTVR